MLERKCGTARGTAELVSPFGLGEVLARSITLSYVHRRDGRRTWPDKIILHALQVVSRKKRSGENMRGTNMKKLVGGKSTLS